MASDWLSQAFMTVQLLGAYFVLAAARLGILLNVVNYLFGHIYASDLFYTEPRAGVNL